MAKTVKDENALENDRRELFCREYLSDLNATQAALRAGYSPETARTQGSYLLTNVDIRKRIGDLMDERSKRTLVDADFVVNGFLEVYRRCIQAEPVMVYDYDARGMVQVEDDEGNKVYTFDSQGANTALSNLAKHLAMFNDKAKVKIEDENGKTITVEYVNA